MTAVWMGVHTKSLLIGEAANPEVIEDAKRRAREPDAVLAVNEVFTLHSGPKFILVNVSVDFHDKVQAGEAEPAIKKRTREIRDAHEDVKRIFIEAERSGSDAGREADPGSLPSCQGHDVPSSATASR